MNETVKSENGIGTAAGKANQLWGDFVPVIAFVLVYNIFRRVDLMDGLINKDTAIFWATETGFWLAFGTHAAREIGAVLGLAVGYVVKYQLDRRYVFTGGRV